LDAGHPIDAADLIAAARASLDRAHVPYSRFPVAAAVVDEAGRVFTGVNIENASYGLTVCAERVAIFAAIAGGAKRIVAVAVTARNSRPITPCGACRQVMAEFCAPDTPIYSDNAPHGHLTWTFAALHPMAFTAASLSNDA
jgi:homotetrameric cytidine deaminase